MRSRVCMEKRSAGSEGPGPLPFLWPVKSALVVSGESYGDCAFRLKEGIGWRRMTAEEQGPGQPEGSRYGGVGDDRMLAAAHVTDPKMCSRRFPARRPWVSCLRGQGEEAGWALWRYASGPAYVPGPLASHCVPRSRSESHCVVLTR